MEYSLDKYLLDFILEIIKSVNLILFILYKHKKNQYRCKLNSSIMFYIQFFR